MRQISKTLGERSAEAGYLQPGFRLEDIPTGVVTVDALDGGMVTTVPREKFPRAAALLIKNGRVKDNGTVRRPGTDEFAAKPDSNPVLKIVAVATPGKDIAVLRITPSSVHVARSSERVAGTTWEAVTHPYDGKLLKVQAAQIFDRLFLADGEGRLSWFSLATKEIKRIDKAPRAKFVTTFADRVVVAHIRDFVGGVSSTGIGWSANADPFDWESFSSGRENLGTSDDITGIFGLETVLVILREGSIWHGTRQPLAAAPFRFSHAVPVGCDLPSTAVQGEGGLFFADFKSKAVYFYQPGGMPQRISEVIDNELFEDLQNLKWAEASFDPFRREYHLGLATEEDSQWITKTWVFAVRTATWSYDDGPVASTLSTFAYPGQTTRVDDLVGLVDNLTGTIDGLSVSELVPPTLFKGTPTGEVLYHLASFDTDFDGTPFEFEFISPDMGPPMGARTMQELVVKVIYNRESTYHIEHSKDREGWKNRKSRTTDFSTNGKEQQIKIAKMKPITGEHLYWRLVATSGDVMVRGYSVRLLDQSDMFRNSVQAL